jgi:hypothetical protein
MRVCGHNGRAVVLLSRTPPHSLKSVQASGYSRDRFVDSQSQVHDLPGCRHVERRERGVKRRGIEQPDPVPDQLRHEVHEDLIDEPSPEALINDVCIWGIPMIVDMPLVTDRYPPFRLAQ